MFELCNGMKAVIDMFVGASYRREKAVSE